MIKQMRGCRCFWVSGSQTPTRRLCGDGKQRCACIAVRKKLKWINKTATNEFRSVCENECDWPARLQSKKKIKPFNSKLWSWRRQNKRTLQWRRFFIQSTVQNQAFGTDCRLRNRTLDCWSFPDHVKSPWVRSLKVWTFYRKIGFRI